MPDRSTVLCLTRQPFDTKACLAGTQGPAKEGQDRVQLVGQDEWRVLDDHPAPAKLSL